MEGVRSRVLSASGVEPPSDGGCQAEGSPSCGGGTGTPSRLLFAMDTYRPFVQSTWCLRPRPRRTMHLDQAGHVTHMATVGGLEVQGMGPRDVRAASVLDAGRSTVTDLNAVRLHGLQRLTFAAVCARDARVCSRPHSGP